MSVTLAPNRPARKEQWSQGASLEKALNAAQERIAELNRIYAAWGNSKKDRGWIKGRRP